MELFVILKSFLLIATALLIICMPLQAHTTKNYEGNFDDMISQLGNSKSVSFYLSKATFSCDVSFTTQEFTHLTKLTPNTFITKCDIQAAYYGLMEKKRFQSIAIDMLSDTTGKHIHFTLNANWIFKKVIFKKFWLRQPGYAELYLQSQGSVFDIDLHDNSIEKIRQHFHEKGYFNCQITDELLYNPKDKTITVEITVKKRSRFKISDVSLTIIDETKQRKNAPGIDFDTLNHQLTHKVSLLTRSMYVKSSAEKQALKIKQLLTSDGFIHARILLKKKMHHISKTVSLIFVVTLGKRKVVTFDGNNIFSCEQLEKFAISNDLPDWLFCPDIITQQIKHEYYKKGYWHTVISYEKKEKTAYHFTIQEGPPSLIKNVQIIDSSTHKTINTPSFLNQSLIGKELDQSMLDQALTKLKNFYASQGFWNFNIINRHFINDKTSNDHSLKITIYKGPRRFLSGCEIKEFKFLETSNFFKRYARINDNQNIPFNIAWLSEQKQYLMKYFHDLGYWYVDVTPELSITHTSEAEIKIFVSWKIKNGPQVVFGKTIIQGGTTIPFKRIQKQLGIKEDALWNQEKVEIARKNLKRLGVFKTVHLQGKNLTKNTSKKPIITTLVDDDPLEIRLRLGYFLTSKNFLFRRQSTPKVGGSIIFKNPTNRADRLSIEADWTKFERNILLDYQQPSLLGFGAISHLKGYSNKYVHPVEIAGSGSAYEAGQHGLAISINDEYKQAYHWGLTLGNEWIETSRVRGDLKFDDKFIDKTLPFFFIEPSIKIDKIDNHVNTKKGSLSFLSLKMMLPESHGDFTAKLLAEQSLFYPIFKNNIIAAARVRFGHIFKGTFNRIPPIERFYLGGPYSVRGYEPDALPPLGVSDCIFGDKTRKLFTIQGGSSMLNINLELRFPLYQQLGAVVFQDFGVLSQSGFSGFSKRWYPGTGFGLRYQTPIGAVRFDIGWKWKRRLQQDTQAYAWYLTLGEAF